MSAAYTAQTLIALLDRLEVSRKGRELRTRCRLCGHNSLYLNAGRTRPLVASCGFCGKEKQSEVLTAANITPTDLGPPLSVDEIRDIWQEVNPDAIVDGDERARRASADVCNAVYGWLVRREECELIEAHAKWLEERGLPAAVARNLGYGSTPDATSASRIAGAAYEIWGSQLWSVPGFYLAGQTPSLAVSNQGIWHPCRNGDGCIVALKVRRPKASHDQRMSTLSSSKYGGPIAASEPHIPLGALAGDCSTVWCTEGERKADLIHQRLKVAVVGLPGVQHVGRLPALLERLKVKRVVAAFDADAAGEQATGRLVEAVFRDGDKYEIEFARWDTGKKPAGGEEADAKTYRPKVDDALVAGVEVKVVTGADPAIQELLRRGSERDEIKAYRKGSVGIAATEILRMEFPPARFAVEGMTVEGLNLLIGRPKAGKSYLALQKAVCVATGQPFIGRKVTQGVVLYIALEDTCRRIKLRLSEMGVTPDTPGIENLFFEPAERWLKHKNRQLPILASYLKEMNGDVVYVVIDTLQRWRGQGDEVEKNAYAQDYNFMSPLWELGNTTATPIEFLHHTRKDARGDYVNDSSGSQGIAGGCDALFTFYREANKHHGRLVGGGRDMTELEQFVVWDKEVRWFTAVDLADVPDDVKAAEQDDGRGPTIAALLTHLVLKHGGGTAKALTDAVLKEKPKIKAASVGIALSKLKADGLLTSEGRGDSALYFPAAGKVVKK